MCDMLIGMAYGGGGGLTHAPPVHMLLLLPANTCCPARVWDVPVHHDKGADVRWYDTHCVITYMSMCSLFDTQAAHAHVCH